jgi:predicted small metal-binding protein
MSRFTFAPPQERMDAAATAIDEGRSMAYQINCDCGYVVKGESEDELVANAEQHIQSDHPDMVGKVSRDDLLGQAEQV